MNPEIISGIGTIIFLVVIGFLALISVLAIYVFIRYGQNKNFTVVLSLVFVGLFFIGALTVFINLLRIF